MADTAAEAAEAALVEAEASVEAEALEAAASVVDTVAVALEADLDPADLVVLIITIPHIITIPTVIFGVPAGAGVAEADGITVPVAAR